jgi:hypothetical protein
MGDLTTNIARRMAGLPLGTLVATPFLEIAKSQAALCDVYLENIYRLAFKDGKPGGEANLVKFAISRPVTDGAGNMTTQDFEVNAPLLALVPVPALTMSEAAVEFTMEVKEQVSDKQTSEKKAGTEVSAKYFGVGVKITGSVSNTKEKTRESNQSAKYVISAKATQQPPAEGMSKLIDILHSTIEPIQVGSVGS